MLANQETVEAVYQIVTLSVIRNKLINFKSFLINFNFTQSDDFVIFCFVLPSFSTFSNSGGLQLLQKIN